MLCKKIGQVYEGKWKLVDVKRYRDGASKTKYYILENIYNGNKIKVRGATFYKMLKGETTMSKIVQYHFQMKLGWYEEDKTNEKARKD